MCPKLPLYFAIPLYLVATAPLVIDSAGRRISNHLDRAAMARVARINAQEVKTQLDLIASALPEHLQQPLKVKP